MNQGQFCVTVGTKNGVSNENNFEWCDHIHNADISIKFRVVKSSLVPHHNIHSYLFPVCITVHCLV
jgi:hypothetical protein